MHVKPKRHLPAARPVDVCVVFVVLISQLPLFRDRIWIELLLSLLSYQHFIAGINSVCPMFNTYDIFCLHRATLASCRLCALLYTMCSISKRQLYLLLS